LRHLRPLFFTRNVHRAVRCPFFSAKQEEPNIVSARQRLDSSRRSAIVEYRDPVERTFGGDAQFVPSAPAAHASRKGVSNTTKVRRNRGRQSAPKASCRCVATPQQASQQVVGSPPPRWALLNRANTGTNMAQSEDCRDMERGIKNCDWASQCRTDCPRAEPHTAPPHPSRRRGPRRRSRRTASGHFSLTTECRRRYSRAARPATLSGRRDTKGRGAPLERLDRGGHE
jgi:hypothetical protein